MASEEYTCGVDETQLYNELEDEIIQNSRDYYRSLLNSSLVDETRDFPDTDFEEGGRRDLQGNLIEEVHRYECIWNTLSSSFKDQGKKKEAWRRISASLRIEGEILYTLLSGRSSSQR